MIQTKMAAPMRKAFFDIFQRKFTISSLSQHRNYRRGIRRHLVNVLSPEEEEAKLKERDIGKRDPRLDIDFNPFDPVKRNLPKLEKSVSSYEKKTQKKHEMDFNSDPVKRNLPKLEKSKSSDGKKTRKKHEKDLKMIPELKQEKIGNITYGILKDEDTNFGKVVMNAKGRKHREEKKEIILEGKRLILDALNAGAKMKFLYFSGRDNLRTIADLTVDAPVYKVTYKSMKIWSDTDTPAGLLALFEKPKEGEALCPPQEPIPVTVICDQIRDPGNMGTLIRTCAAVGCKRILAMKGCVDVWEPKVIRAGAGSHFRVPIINNLPWEYIPGYIPESCDVFVADILKPTEKRIHNFRKTSSENLQQLIDLDEASEDDSDMEEEQKEDDVVDEFEVVETDDSFKNQNALKKYANAPLPVKSFYEVTYSSNSNILVIGGETTGISVEARKLAFDYCGQVITIPMCDGINSLNTSIAGSVILYEMYKHLTKSKQNVNT